MQVQVGRFKIPQGLYGESLDVDAARTSIFLPVSIYALRAVVICAPPVKSPMVTPMIQRSPMLTRLFSR